MDIIGGLVQHLPELANNFEKLNKVKDVLYVLGICAESELIYVKADDLTSVLTTIQARKLIVQWQQEFNAYQEENQSSLVETQLDESTASISNVEHASIQRTLSSHTVDSLELETACSTSSAACSSVSHDTESIASSSPSPTSWPTNFTLPKFDEQISEYLESMKDKSLSEVAPVSKRLRRKIVDTLFRKMFQYTIYPERYQYHQVCNTLVSKYPCLRDRFSLDGSFYMVWLDSLRSKFKEARRNDTTAEFQKQIRRKYGHTKSTVTEDESSCKRQKRSGGFPSMQEDNDTISKHKKCMELELRKRSPSLDIVADRMSRTFSDRRARISIAMTVADILKEYPALKLCDMLIEEMQRIHQCAFALLSSGTFAAKSASIINWKKVPKVYLDIYGQGSSPLLCIPAAFNESWKCYLAVNEEPATPYPTLTTSENKFKLLVEGCEINGVKDFNHGLAAMVAAYWVFNLEFPITIKKSLSFICGYILKLPKIKILPSVQRVINKM